MEFFQKGFSNSNERSSFIRIKLRWLRVKQCRIKTNERSNELKINTILKSYTIHSTNLQGSATHWRPREILHLNNLILANSYTTLDPLNSADAKSKNAVSSTPHRSASAWLLFGSDAWKQPSEIVVVKETNSHKHYLQSDIGVLSYSQMNNYVCIRVRCLRAWWSEIKSNSHTFEPT